MNQKLRKIIAIILIASICLASVPMDAIADEVAEGIAAVAAALGTEKTRQAAYTGDTVAAVTIHTAEDLLALCKKNAGYYADATIYIAPTNDALDMTEVSGFNGLGSEDYPFRGTIQYSGNVSGAITLNKPLFLYLSQDATIASNLILEAAGNMTGSLLAANYVTGSEKADNEITITISTAATSDDTTNMSYSTFGGIIGTMGTGTSLSLNVTSHIQTGYGKIDGSSNRGFFCNTMGENASLTIAAYDGVTDYTVNSSQGDAGALVGTMGAGASLTVGSDFTYTGSVKGNNNAGGLVGQAETGAKITLSGDTKITGTITSSTYYAGGIVGTGVNTDICVSAGKIVTIQATVNGKSNSGGLIGKYTFSGVSEADTYNNWDIAPYIINDVSFATGAYAGGLFGVLENTSKDGVFTIVDSSNGECHVSSSNQGNASFGGLIGFYGATNLAASLVVEKVAVSSTCETTSKSNGYYGGIIGEVDSATNSYVKIENAAVTVEEVQNSKVLGGLVGVSNGGSMFDVGSVTISGSLNNSNLTARVYGGIIGTLDSGVLRLSGKTNISAITSPIISPKAGQIVGTRTSALIYAMGSGSDYNENTKTGWTLIRDGSGRSVSDVGSWGEVVRIDGTNLKELQVDKDSAQNTENLLIYNTVAHTVTIEGFSAYDGSRGHIKSVQNFAAIALSYQCTDATGALQLAVTKMESQWWIYLDADVDLTGTGITGFLRDNGTSVTFAGKLDGQGHKITMAVGETYGVLSEEKTVDSTEGCGQIYNHKYLGLFAKANYLSYGISNLTVDGTIQFGNTECSSQSNSMDVLCGILVANQTGGTNNYKKVTSSVKVTYGNGSLTGKMLNVYAGGMVGYVENGTNLVFENCTWNGTFTNNCNAYEFYIGGYIGTMCDDKDGSITVTNCNIGGNITVVNKTDNARVGGLLATTRNNGTGKITITASTLTVQDLTVTCSEASTSAGGLLGYNWHNVDFNVNGLTVKNSTLTAKNAGFGGLVYEASGYWKVYDKGIQFSGTNTFYGKSVNDTPSALLVCRGDDYLKKDYALYLEIGAGAYRVDNTTNVSLTNNNSYFDELVGITIGSNGNGVVSIATDNGHSQIDQTECNTYTHQLAKSYNNSHTRYYYNLDGYRIQNNKTWADATVESGDEMLLWSVAQYCETNLQDYFLVSGTTKDSVTIQGTINLGGLSYYPIAYTGAVTIKDASITFGYSTIETAEADNKQPSNNKQQHYMMQDGLFLTITSSNSTAASMTIQGNTGLTLSGTIGQLNKSDYSGGSGALICGEAKGVLSGTTAQTFTFAIASDSKLVLNDLRVSDVTSDNYAPLLINQVGSYSSLNVINVSTSGYSDTTTKAATSLLGNVGSENSVSIVLLFEGLNLNGRSAESIFSKATLMESYRYSITDTTSAGTYNFNKGDEAITYGKELSNGVNGNGTAGRNPYDIDEGTGQVWYCDKFGSLQSDNYVTDGIVTANVEKGFFTSDYLRYVYVQEGGTNGTELYKHEIDINQQVVNILEGCGTYDDPYIIDTEGQLETLGKFLSTGIIAGWQLNISYEVASKTGTGSLATDSGSHYLYTSGSTWTASADANGATLDGTYGLTSAQVLAYMRNAYYMVTEDITLKSTFYGLGGSDSTTSVFSGVIVGKKKTDGTYPTITISSRSSTTHSYFGGLIAYSGGSVVKNLILNYAGELETTKLTLASKSPSQERKDQSFFGGVIGYVVGGDNIIDNVQVTGLDKFSLTITGTNANLTAVGGYVGLVGGNTEAGGGVIFRNMSNSSGFTGSDYAAGSSYYYRNPYVGRVLDGYACAEECTVENTDKNYTIPTIATGTEKISTTGLNNNTATITIGNAAQLWTLSAIVNSGAGGMNQDNRYNNTAYNLGCVRTGTYDAVGSTASKQDAADCRYWGGISYTDANKVSHLVDAYTTANGSDSNYIAYTTGGSYCYSITFSGDCDMTEYGNGFRGIGTSYTDNSTATVKERTIYLGGTVGGNTTTPCITLNRNVKEYATEGTSGWWTEGMGLFPVVNFAAATTVQKLTIDGSVRISYDDSTYTGETTAGAFAGMTANGSTTDTITFSQVTMGGDSTNALTISGAKYCGGFIGVVGQSSRNSTKNVVTVGTAVGNYVFDSCTYNHITVEGSYSAGGLIGTYKNTNQTLTIQSKGTFANSKIAWTKDACLDVYQLTNNASDAQSNAYSGAGGLVGCYSGGTMTVGTSTDTEYPYTFTNLSIYGSKNAYTTQYGIGGIVGTMTATSCITYGVQMTNITVAIDLTLAYTSQKTNDTSYYTTPAAGGVIGYAQGKPITLNRLSITDSRILNAAYAGGTIGAIGSANSSSGDVTIATMNMSDVVVYTKGAASYDGSSNAGGIIGNNSNTKGLILTDAVMAGVTVVSDGVSGLLDGYTLGNSSLKITNLTTTACNVITTQNETGSYFIGGDTSPDKTSVSKQAVKTAGAAGIFLGACAGDGTGQYDVKLSTLNAFNVEINDCMVGYYTGNADSLTYTKDSEGDWSFSVTLSEKNVGVYHSDTQTGTPYADITYSEENSYTDGKLGLLIGGASAISTMKVVGISVQDGYYPFEENGYDNIGINSDADNYIIYGDYTGAAVGESANKAGTINKDYKKEYTTDIAAPYVVVNPTADMNIYQYKDMNDKMALLTGDGTVKSAIDQIIQDVTTTSASKSYNLTYRKIKSLAEKFGGGGNGKESGTYADNYSTYYTASESNANSYGNLNDFPVLVVDSTSSSEITELVKSYISLLTNCDQTGSGESAVRYTDIAIQTYQWNSTYGRFVAASDNTLIYASGLLSVNGNLHDNQNNQFTLIDVRYQNGANSSQYYHLYIPVVVKKVLQVDFTVKMLSGSSTYNAVYGNNAVLAGYGENYTAQLTYSYTWTAAEWNSYIAADGNMLWSYDKQVQLDNKSNDTDNDLTRDTTRLTLVDTNRYGQGNTYFTTTGDKLTTDSDSETVLVFNKLSGYTSVPICDLLSLKATKDSNGKMQITGTGNADEIPTGSTLRIWDADKAQFIYYGPKTDSSADGYTIQLVKSDGTAYEDTEDVTISEVYYLIANCTKGEGVHARMLSLGETKLTSTSSAAIAARMKKSGTKYYTLGDFYSVSNTTINTSSESGSANIEVSTNDKIEVEVSAKVNVPDEQADEFKQYTSGTNSCFRFAIELSNGSSACAIDATYIAVEELKIGGTTLSAEDYTGEVVNGVYYITITSQKATAYQNQTVSAKLLFSYEDDTGRIAAQFPERGSGEDGSGVNFLVHASIAYNQNVIDGSSMSDSAQGGTKYYREKMEIASTSYNAYSTASEDGNTSQLGINGREVSSTNGQTITSLGMYNATQLSSLSLTDASSDKYPALLVGKLKLEKKTDQEDGKTKYEQVDISTYLQNITVTSAKGTTVSGEVSEDGIYTFTIKLTADQIARLSTDQLEMNISYLVLSDEALQNIGVTGQYANYKVTLTAHLANRKGKSLADDTSDYLIYTNAKFYLGIVGVNDLGNSETENK